MNLENIKKSFKMFKFWQTLNVANIVFCLWILATGGSLLAIMALVFSGIAFALNVDTASRS